MALEDIDDGGAIDLERKRGISPWLIFGVALAVFGLVFGVRRARAPKSSGDAAALGQQPS